MHNLVVKYFVDHPQDLDVWGKPGFRYFDILKKEVEQYADT